MDTIERLIAVVDLHIDATGMKPAAVSLRAFQHTAKLLALRNGSDNQVRFVDEALKRRAAVACPAGPVPELEFPTAQGGTSCV